MARWGDEKTIHFIYLYRQRECLWNTRSQLYKNKLAREYAYQSILQQFNDPNLDLKSVKTKIKNLRSVYHTELKKVKDNTRIGSDGSVYRPSLSWFDEMHAFLGDLEDRADSTVKSEMETDDSAVLSLQDAKIEHITIEATLEPHLDPLHDNEDTEATSDTNTCDGTEISPSTSAQEYLKSIKRRLTRRSRPYDENSVLNAIQRLENRVTNVVNKVQQEQSHLQREDEFHMFALSVAAQLRQLPLHIAISTQSKIQNTLSEARLASIFSNSLSSNTLSIKTNESK